MVNFLGGADILKKNLHAFGLHSHYHNKKAFFFFMNDCFKHKWHKFFCLFLKGGSVQIFICFNAQTLCILLSQFSPRHLFVCCWFLNDHVHDYPAICKCSPHNCFLLIHLQMVWTNNWRQKLVCCFNITYCNLNFFFFFLSELRDVYGGNVLCVNLISTIHWHAGLTC